jgi:hypothetical protein
MKGKKSKKLKKPVPKQVPLLVLDDCLEYAEQEGVITKDIADEIIDYAKGLGIESGYWDLMREDLDEDDDCSWANSEPEKASGFRKFYDLFKEYEVKDEDPHLHFDVVVFS